MILEFFIAVITLTAIIITSVVTYSYFSDFKSDYQIYKHGNTYSENCSGAVWHGKIKYLEVTWIEEENIHIHDKLEALSKLREFLYSVIVYSWNHKSNLGIYTLMYDILHAILYAIIAVTGVISFLLG